MLKFLASSSVMGGFLITLFLIILEFFMLMKINVFNYKIIGMNKPDLGLAQ